MIRTNTEYREAQASLAAEKQRLAGQRRVLRTEGLSQAEIKRALDPFLSFHLQLAEEVATYERLQRGEFSELDNFRGLGRLLIALRIYRGISQRDLAARLDVHESQVSRDERNEYHGITVNRAAGILDALGAQLASTVVLQSDSQSGK